MAASSCPVCGGGVEYRSGAPYTVCRYCRALLVRKEAQLESVGQVAEVPEDFSPLQLGTTGRYEGRRFSLIGRLRKVWDEGSWNEWCALLEPNVLGWLAEAQGDLVMTFERPASALPPGLAPAALAALLPDSVLLLEGRRYSISDVKQVRCSAAEGELAESALAPAMTCIDVRGPGTAFGTIEIAAGDARLYLGRFVEFAECGFAGLRRLAGWPSP